MPAMNAAGYARIADERTAKAKELLSHYFGLGNSELHGDNWTEINEIVDHIVAASVARLKSEIGAV